MNCGPNQLARVINHPNTRYYNLVDKIVKTTSFFIDESGFDSWYVEEGIRVVLPGEDASRPLLGLADQFLRPIDNPGDEVEDESKAWLPPVPVLENV